MSQLAFLVTMLILMPQKFTDLVNEVFFKTNCNYTIEFVDELRQKSQLTLLPSSSRIYSISNNWILEDQDSLSKTVLKFTFHESPFPDLSIDSGVISLLLIESSKEVKVIEINWTALFFERGTAEQFYHTLIERFEKVSISRFDEESDDAIGLIKSAEFSSKDEEEKIKDITISMCRTQTWQEGYDITIQLRNRLSGQYQSIK